MHRVHRAQVVALALGVATVGNALVSAQLDGGGPGRAPAPPDIAQEWRLDNNERDTFGQAPLGDYTGIPFNDAGRMRSDTTPESIWGTLEYQCRPHSSPHQWRGLGGARILKEQEPIARGVSTYHIQFMRSLDRPVFMDGRPHPPAWAPHTWTGFSTGQWVGNTLKITTTHLKDGFLRRGSPQTSDMYSMTEFLTRHDDILTIVTVIDDPIYLDQPYVHSTTYTVAQRDFLTTEQCNGSFSENGGTDRHWVPHFLPGSNQDALMEWLTQGDPRSNIGGETWVPTAAARGGLKTLYPEYRSTINGNVADAAKVTALTVPASPVVVKPAEAIAAQSPRDGQVHVMPVQGNVYMLVADGNNITASIGPDGVALVNTGGEKITDKVVAALEQLVKQAVAPRPNECFGASCAGTWGWSSPYIHSVISSPGQPKFIRQIVNTSASPEHTGGNVKLVSMGTGFRAGGLAGAVAEASGAPVIAHENVLSRMSAPAGKQAPTPTGAWPTVTYFDDFFKFPTFFNGEGVTVHHEPAANTDGDSIVLFRRSEVIATGDIFSTVSYPLIDTAKGGSLQGVIKALNHILDLSFAEYRSQGGTLIIPGRGRLSDTADVAYYRNMLVMIRDRVQDLKNKGMTLAQVKAARPSLDFDGRYGATTGPWTTDMFIEAVYRSQENK